MLIDFIYELRAQKVPVGTSELLSLMDALEKNAHQTSFNDFYHLSRALLIHSEKHLDLFDGVFAKHFQGIEFSSLQIRKEFFEWLSHTHTLDEETRARLQASMLDDEWSKLSMEELRKKFEETLAKQKEAHHGGNRWVGTGGSSPWGHSGMPRPGFRVGGSGGNRSAIAVTGERRYQAYREDLILDIRQMGLALRKLRSFASEGQREELDVEGTIEHTAKNAGELDIKTRKEKKPNVRLILMMDVGGSMDPHAFLCSRLFSAAKQATHFKELRTYYFHNCIYGRVYHDANFTQSISIHELLRTCDQNYKLILLGDAQMAPYELLSAGSDLNAERMQGIAWLQLLHSHFKRSCWINPEPEAFWNGTSVEIIKGLYDMYTLSLQGLEESIRHLTKK